jgi:outer membrane biosynthesis protein TonB
VPPALAVAAPAAPEPAAAAADPTALYSNVDQDVNPPKLLYPQVPPVPILFATNDDVNVMEIVVADNGSVERVKLVSQPKRLTDMMLLSGAKNWKFAPASRNGQAVRYRIALRWATTQ